MKDLTLLIWIIFYPLFTTVNDYYNAKLREMTNRKHSSEEMYKKCDLLYFAIWIAGIIYFASK